MEGATLKLLYFDVAAKAECIRLAMAYGGIEFDDHRFSGVDEFTELKQNGLLRFGQVHPGPFRATLCTHHSSVILLPHYLTASLLYHRFTIH